MKKIIFLCKNNACRSQMAEAFAAKFGGGVLEAKSAGAQPAAEVDRMAKAVMHERGFAMDDVMPRGIESFPGQRFDLCVHFGCLEEDVRDKINCGQVFDWGTVEDPQGKTYAAYRRTREEIGRKVMDLIKMCGDQA